ncbi:nuclease HARBI1 [Labeo rohita]|uniref:Putative nuclease HARBI1 n=1 Tax=Labeo rohita TaxID=84645 RepID=A0A498NJ59_LABRO|nr:nuclease HARBI1 [Labeo rohita]
MGPHLQRRTRRNQAIPVQVQVLSVLGFLATGTFQREIGDRSGISQSTFSRILPDVLRGIIGLCPQLIRFPYSAQEQRDVRQDFLRKTGFPNVIGAIDCTHVAIRAPHVNEYMYVNRKNFHSINVQLICDARMAILNAVARWPGSTHDSFIVRNCSVGNRLEAGAGRDGWLLGLPQIKHYHGWKRKLRVGDAHDGMGMKRLVVAEVLSVMKMRPLVRILQFKCVQT